MSTDETNCSIELCHWESMPFEYRDGAFGCFFWIKILAASISSNAAVDNIKIQATTCGISIWRSCPKDWKLITGCYNQQRELPSRKITNFSTARQFLNIPTANRSPTSNRHCIYTSICLIGLPIVSALALILMLVVWCEWCGCSDIYIRASWRRQSDIYNIRKKVLLIYRHSFGSMKYWGGASYGGSIYLAGKIDVAKSFLPFKKS